MMATLYIEPIHESGETLRLVRAAIESEMAKLELALKRAVQRLASFEGNCGELQSTAAAMTAEDLEGKDDEYVLGWKYRLMQRLQEKYVSCRNQLP
jgi:hypothetical protein